MKENYFITGLENKLRNIRRKCKMLGRTKIIVWTMCYQFTSYQLKKSCELSSKQIWTSQIKENVVVRDSILEVDLKINSGNWSLVVIQKFFLLKTNWSEKLLSRQVGRTLPDGSLDMRHLIIMLTKMKYCKQCYCDFVVYVSDWIFVNICVIYLYFIMRYV